jgi:muconolactone delta-isomerase
MTKILVMCVVDPVPADQVDRIMLEEVKVVTRQYVEGKLEQFWRREDGKGGVLLYDTESLEEAEALVKALPLTQAEFLTYELIPLGPLTQLGRMVQALEQR